MSEPYDHKQVEKKWQDRWAKEDLYEAGKKGGKKRYVLDMFPYPSGTGLHVGHVEGYTATDIYSRYSRMQGYDVLHPMGWDAFGLPAENYAIKTGTPPKETTDTAIGNFRRQIQSLGLSYDWSREVGTHNPDYYRFTQWFFLFLHKQGLAEKRLANVNWCPKDQTVLANEQVVDGACERCGTEVVQKDLEQWFFKITKFADALVKDLDDVDWPASTKLAQRNWIGKSEGAEIDFEVTGSDQKITVFTTRADTLHGATFLVLAPEHPLTTIYGSGDAQAYVEKARKKSELERTTNKEKTGVVLNVKAINPATKEEIPIYVADYVLMGYGTGAIMAVPGHDERDREFAEKYGLPIKTVVDESMPPSDEAKGKITSEFGRAKTTYKLRDWLVSRQRYWGAPIPMVYDPEGKVHPIPEEHLPWLLPTDVEFKPTGVSPLGQSKELVERTEKIFGKDWRPEVDTLDTFVCSSWYFFRFTEPHNEKEFAGATSLKHWMPVDLYMGGAEHTVLHLMYARFFTKALQEAGLVGFGEPFLKLRHQGTILAEDGSKMSKSKGNVVNPDDVVDTFGADTLRLYEMFMGPLEAMKPWNTENIMGARRFVERVWRLADKVQDGDVPELEPLLNQTIQKVGEDVESFSLNTGISQMMIFLNAAEKGGVGKMQFESLLKLLAPFAPHMTDELWERLGHTTSIHLEAWPTYDATKAQSGAVTIAVQIAGKTRGTVTVPRGTDEDGVLGAVKGDPKISKYIDFEPRKTIFVQDRILNLIP